MHRALQGLLLLILTLGLGLFSVTTIRDAMVERTAKNSRPPAGQERRFTVHVARVNLGSVRPRVTSYGEVQSLRNLEVRAAAPGRIVEMSPHFRNGGEVKKGDLLFQTDPAPLKTAVGLSQAMLRDAEAEFAESTVVIGLLKSEVDAAEAELALRRKALERQNSLKERGVGTDAAIEAAELSVAAANQVWLSKRSALSQAQARITRAEIDLERQKINLADNQRILGDSRVLAAFDGVISNVSVELGALVNLNEEVGRLVDLGQLEVAFRLSAKEFGRLTETSGGLEQAEVSVQPSNQEDLFAAEILRVGAMVEEDQTGREIYAAIEGQAADRLRPGDFVTVTLLEPPLKDVALIPATATSAEDKVFVLTSEDRLQEVAVDILHRQGDQLIVRGELDGRELVLVRTPLLGTGVSVLPVRQQVEAQGLSGKTQLAADHSNTKDK